MAKMLQENTTLKTLDLSGRFNQKSTKKCSNSFTDINANHTGSIVRGDGLNAFVDALSLNNSLTRLSFTCEKQKQSFSCFFRHFVFAREQMPTTKAKHSGSSRKLCQERRRLSCLQNNDHFLSFEIFQSSVVNGWMWCACSNDVDVGQKREQKKNGNSEILVVWLYHRSNPQGKGTA